MEMSEKLYQLRKERGWSQEEVAVELQVSRQTVSKWESGATMPDTKRLKQLSDLYGIGVESLLKGSALPNAQQPFDTASDLIDWTSAWAKKYPILQEYKTMEDIHKHQEKIDIWFQRFQQGYGTNDLDTFLILKDMLYQSYLKRNEKNKADRE
jgi:transcriptional regulator with XRE-family HTH domain